MEAIVKAICAKEGITCEEAHPLSGGQVNQVYLVDGRYVVRIGAREDAHQRLQCEAELLQSLEGKIPVARVLAFGQLQEQVYQIQQYLPGEKMYLVWKDLSPKEQEAVAVDIVEALKVLHEMRFDDFGYAHEAAQHAPTWSEYLTGKFRRTLSEIEALQIRMAPGAVEMAAEYFEAHQAALAEAVPTLVHCDMTMVNMLVDQGRLSAILDFEFAMQAPADYELVAMEAFCLYPNDWAEEDNEVYCTADFAGLFPLLQKHYPALFATPHVRERMNLYQIDVALGSYLAWRKANLATYPPERMAGKDFYMGRISNIVWGHGARMFFA